MADQHPLVAHLAGGALEPCLARANRRFQDLSARIGHDFADPAWLTLALTHASARAGLKPDQDNERLEFLGDRVLGLAVAELLADTFPKAREGELARWFNQLVRAETCAEVAQQWELGDFILMSGGEAGSGGRRKKTILANTCEAVLGAVFADAGYEAAKEVVRRFWEPQFAHPRACRAGREIPVAGMGARPRPAVAALSRSGVARAPTMRRVSPPRCRSKASRRNAGRGPISERPSRRRRLPCCCAKACGRRRNKMASPTADEGAADPLRLRGADRRAE